MTRAAPTKNEAADTPGAGTADAGTGTVSRALNLLGLLADVGGRITVKQVAEYMNLAPSTAHRLLQLLKKDGFVEATAEGRQYSIGPQFYRIAAKVVATVSQPEIAQRTLDTIANALDETVVYGLYLPTEKAMSFAARADGQQKLKYQIDLHRPSSLVWGASGKAILAFLPIQVIHEILREEGPSPATGAPVPSYAEIESELTLIRQRGYAVSESQKLPDARGIAAPVFGVSGVIGSICLTSPKSRMPKASIDAIGKDICFHAQALSRNFGAPEK